LKIVCSHFCGARRLRHNTWRSLLAHIRLAEGLQRRRPRLVHVNGGVVLDRRTALRSSHSRANLSRQVRHLVPESSDLSRVCCGRCLCSLSWYHQVGQLQTHHRRLLVSSHGGRLFLRVLSTLFSFCKF
jgi:hypothetical protein